MKAKIQLNSVLMAAHSINYCGPHSFSCLCGIGLNFCGCFCCCYCFVDNQDFSGLM